MVYDTLVLVIDNFDSFVYNIANILAEHGARPIVVRNNEITVSGIERIAPDRIVLSPGPGNPLDSRHAGVTLDVVRKLGSRIPILGIGLGHQVIGVAYGAKVRRARRIMHGKLDIVEHFGDKLYYGVPKTFTVIRYHSLVVDELPGELIVTARSTSDSEIMGMRHVEHPIHGVQFNPESVAVPQGPRILRNFLDDPW